MILCVVAEKGEGSNKSKRVVTQRQRGGSNKSCHFAQSEKLTVHFEAGLILRTGWSTDTRPGTRMKMSGT
jgi:hypothetical protein